MKRLTVKALEAVINASGQGVVVFAAGSDDRAVVFVNDELLRLTGITKSAFHDNGLADLFAVFDDAGLADNIERCLGGESTTDMLLEGTRSDRSIFHCMAHLNVLEKKSRGVSRVALYFRELHEPQLGGQDERSVDFESAMRSDRLTGLCQRRYFERILTREWGSAIREKGCIALFLIQIDEFSQYKNTFGRQAADSCLSLVARAVKTVARRSSDLAGRFESEIFVTMARNMDEAQCELLGQRIVKQVSNLCIHHPHSTVHNYVSVSVGAVQASPTVGTFPLQAVEEARDALDEAMARGGRQVLTRQFQK